MKINELVKAEMWKKSAVLGWVGFLVVLALIGLSAIVAIFKGCTVEGCSINDMIYRPDAGTVSIILGTLAVGHGGQWVKRATEFRPEEVARADVIRENGNGDGEAAARRRADPYEAEFAG